MANASRVRRCADYAKAGKPGANRNLGARSRHRKFRCFRNRRRPQTSASLTEEQMSSVSDAVRRGTAPALGTFERYLTVWVALCIAGIVLGRLTPGPFQVLG